MHMIKAYRLVKCSIEETDEIDRFKTITITLSTDYMKRTIEYVKHKYPDCSFTVEEFQADEIEWDMWAPLCGDLRRAYADVFVEGSNYDDAEDWLKRMEVAEDDH